MRVECVSGLIKHKASANTRKVTLSSKQKLFWDALVLPPKERRARVLPLVLLRIPTAQELSGSDGGGGGTVLVLRQNFEAPPCYYDSRLCST